MPKIKNIPFRFKKSYEEIYKKEGLFNFFKYCIDYPFEKLAFVFGRDVVKNYSNVVNLIKNKRILILGAGNSANDLEKIPKDVIILSCNLSPQILINKKINRKIDLYFCTRRIILDKGTDIISNLLSKVKVNIFITDYPRWIKKREDLREFYEKTVRDRGENNFYLKELIKPYQINQIRGKSLNHTSSGMRLLQYALYFKAKEIYLIGIDGLRGTYFTGKMNKKTHLDIDNNFMKIVSNKFENVYSASRSSPITKYVPHKKLK